MAREETAMDLGDVFWAAGVWLVLLALPVLLVLCIA